MVNLQLTQSKNSAEEERNEKLPLRSAVEVRNQARVHLWFEGKFGEPYGPLSCTAEALERFASSTFAVGVRLESDDRPSHIRRGPSETDSLSARIWTQTQREQIGKTERSHDVELGIGGIDCRKHLGQRLEIAGVWKPLRG